MLVFATRAVKDLGAYDGKFDKHLHVKAEVHHIAIFDNVFLTFQTPFAGLFGSRFALVFNEVFIANDFSANEALLKVSVNNAGSFGCCAVQRDSPGTYFFYTCSEISVQT